MDSSECGDLESSPLLAPYSVEQKHGTFSAVDMMNYSVNVYDNGNVLEIVTNAGNVIGFIIGSSSKFKIFYYSYKPPPL